MISFKCKLVSIVCFAGLTTILLSAGASSAGAWTNSSAREALRAHHFKPTALFPSSLPPRLEGTDVLLSIGTKRNFSSQYSVTWDLGADSLGYRGGYIYLTRQPRSALNDLRHPPRVSGTIVHKAHLPGVNAWHFCGHRCGYFFLRNNRVYIVGGIYWIIDGVEQYSNYMAARDERYIISKLTSVR